MLNAFFVGKLTTKDNTQIHMSVMRDRKRKMVGPRYGNAQAHLAPGSMLLLRVGA
jgi:hypothetical protein